VQRIADPLAGHREQVCSRLLLHDGEIVAVDYFFVGSAAEDLGDFVGAEALDSLDLG
jgi:hypothetical protein